MGNPASDYLKEYRTEHIAVPPAGWSVKTILPGPDSEHQVRIAFPPGRRKKGSGKLVSILHPKGENPKKCKAREQGIGNREQKNPSRAAVNPNGTAAAQLYTDFHGRAPSEVLKFQEDLMASGDYTALGDMGSLWLEPVPGDPEKWPVPSIEFEKKDKVKLATDPGGKQLYLVGGNQTLPLDYLAKKGVQTDKRFISLGIVYGISYRTEKKFDGYRTFEYAHKFGEETGERPLAYYDAELERIVLVGGAYSIADPDDGLGASPGIVN